MRELFIDFETFSSVDLKTCGMHRYVEAPDFEIMLCAYAFDDEPVCCLDMTTPEGRKVFYRLTNDLWDVSSIKIAHNAPFEMACLRKTLRKAISPRQWRCSAVQAAYLALPRSLDGVSKFLNLEKPKDKIGDSLIRLFCKPQKPTKAHPETRRTRETDPEKWELFKAYCARDVESEREAWRRMQKVPVPDFEWEYWFMDQDINERGMQVDMDLVTEALAMDKRYREGLMAEAKRLTGLMNPNSGKQLLEWLKTEMPEDMVESIKKTEVQRLLNVANASDQVTICKVLEIRQELAKTSVKKYAALRKSVCADGRLRGSLLFYGAARTHRWCLAEGTLVRTRRGDVPIEQVTLEDELWDGENWVTHEGVVFSGDKEVITWDGVTATPQHIVWVGPDEKMTLGLAMELGRTLWSGS